MIWSKSNSLIVSTIKFKSRRPKKDTTPKQQNFKKAKESAYFADFNEQINPKDLSKKYHKWREFKICIQILNQLVSILEIKQVMNLELELERIRNWRGNVMNCANSETFANEKSSEVYVLSGPSEETSLFPSTLKYRYFGIRMSWSVDLGGKFKFHHVAKKTLLQDALKLFPHTTPKQPNFKQAEQSAYFADFDVQKDNLSSYPARISNLHAFCNHIYLKSLSLFQWPFDSPIAIRIWKFRRGRSNLHRFWRRRWRLDNKHLNIRHIHVKKFRMEFNDSHQISMDFFL